MKKFFFKYEGAGNDFIIFDNREKRLQFQQQEIEKICNRHFGAGADGMILLQEAGNADFEMIYYNADGKIGSMCGNGARCTVHLARHLGMIKTEARFAAYDGIHHAAFITDDVIKISMGNVKSVQYISDDLLIDSGSPHYIKFVDSLELDVVGEGRKIRYSKPFKEAGVNVNFLQLNGNGISMRTYERGVEDETLSCGTGTVASAIAASLRSKTIPHLNKFEIQAPGGKLKVYFTRQDDGTFSDIWLEGPVKMVFTGELPE